MRFEEELKHNEQISGYIPTSPVSPIVLFALFILGIATLWLAERHFPNEPIIKGILEHLASAIIVASVLGVSYEFLVHKYRAWTLTKILENQRTKLYEALRVFMLTTPSEVFFLLQEIAEQTKPTPTLYTPARQDDENSDGEYTFAKSIEFFDVLVEVRRAEIVNILREWIKPQKSANLGFLASDFIGKYQLSELADDLHKITLKGFGSWNSLDIKEKNRILNFMWATSRCENNKYNWLRRLLLETDSIYIQEWILFIPQQMPEDREFLEIVTSYLEFKKDTIKRNKEEYKKCVLIIGASLASLERKYQSEGKEILIKHKDIFSEYKDMISNNWTDIGFPLKEFETINNERRLNQ